ncbi:MAG: hypothetical protein K0R41_3880 [Geminicoccaceae bacterium]|nr:hypothetical protein [Geminicoccaceae bacterium]
MDDQPSRLGIGLYTAAEASRLLDLPPARLRRWLGGYRSAGHAYDPLWTVQLPRLDDRLGLGFLDLMQLRVVARIVVETQISLQALRKALLLAQELIHHRHPFATTRFRTDGRRLFLEIGRETKEPALFDVLGKQYGFHRIIEPSFRDVDLEAEITRWWPLGKQRSVVLDPQRSFGAPIVNKSGIPTATLARAAESDGSPREVTRWYPATEREVRDAIAFERRLAGLPARQMAA